MLFRSNIRELKDVVLFAAYKVAGKVITASDLPISRSSPEIRNSLRLRDPKTEKERISEALAQTKGNITHAAKLLGIGRTTLLYKLKQHGLK